MSPAMSPAPPAVPPATPATSRVRILDLPTDVLEEIDRQILGGRPIEGPAGIAAKFGIGKKDLRKYRTELLDRTRVDAGTPANFGMRDWIFENLERLAAANLEAVQTLSRRGKGREDLAAAVTLERLLTLGITPESAREITAAISGDNNAYKTMFSGIREFREICTTLGRLMRVEELAPGANAGAASAPSTTAVQVNLCIGLPRDPALDDGALEMSVAGAGAGAHAASAHAASMRPTPALGLAPPAVPEWNWNMDTADESGSESGEQQSTQEPGS